MWHILDYQKFSQFTPYLPLAKNDCLFFLLKRRMMMRQKREGRAGGRKGGQKLRETGDGDRQGRDRRKTMLTAGLPEPPSDSPPRDHASSKMQDGTTATPPTSQVFVARAKHQWESPLKFCKKENQKELERLWRGRDTGTRRHHKRQECRESAHGSWTHLGRRNARQPVQACPGLASTL